MKRIHRILLDMACLLRREQEKKKTGISHYSLLIGCSEKSFRMITANQTNKLGEDIPSSGQEVGATQNLECLSL